MKISIITLFPEMFDKVINTSILGRAQKKDKVKFELINLRDFGEGRHQVVDSKPYGGGIGMVLKPDILAKALNNVKKTQVEEKCITILTSASGNLYKQARARELSKLNHLIIICGHYEGVDQRFIDKYIDEEISIGDYVLTGGEIPAMIIIDTVTRLILGVLEKEGAIIDESFTDSNLLEYPQYTRPQVFEDIPVPEILTSGNHGQITKWRQQQAVKKTNTFRPDLIIQKD